jgi:hypothetical protein
MLNVALSVAVEFKGLGTLKFGRIWAWVAFGSGFCPMLLAICNVSLMIRAVTIL